jgi:hypothetical protein
LHPEDKRVARIHRKLGGAEAIAAADQARLRDWLQANFGGRPLRLLVVLECPAAGVDDDTALALLGPGELLDGFDVPKGAYVIADKGLREQLGRAFKASYTFEKFKVFPLEKPALWHLRD